LINALLKENKIYGMSRIMMNDAVGKNLQLPKLDNGEKTKTEIKKETNTEKNKL